MSSKRMNRMEHILNSFQCKICGSKESICNGFSYACYIGDPGYWHKRYQSTHHGIVFTVPDCKEVFRK
jgi:hypothetical protein